MHQRVVPGGLGKDAGRVGATHQGSSLSAVKTPAFNAKGWWLLARVLGAGQDLQGPRAFRSPFWGVCPAGGGSRTA